MKLVLAFYGTRGDVEPGIAVGRELMRRGHDVQMAVPPDLIGSAEAVGLTAVAYGPDTQSWLENTRDFWGYFFRNFWRVRDVKKYLEDSRSPGMRAWGPMTRALASVAGGADLLVTGVSYEELVFDVAEYCDVPLATVLWYPMRVNGKLLPFLPEPVVRMGMKAGESLIWRGVKKEVDKARRELGLAPATGPVPGRIAQRQLLEIQAYDDALFPGLAEEWARWSDQRPFVGTLTLELATEEDSGVMSWIAAGTPPICFGFGSIPVESPADMIRMIAGACAQVGERALVCAGWTDFSDVPEFDHVKVVGAVNYATIFPACRAVVHHGGAGTTAAGLRAGIPTLVLYMADVQMIWGAAIKKLKVGSSRKFASATEKRLVKDLRTILAPDYRTRARELGARMIRPADSVTRAADLLEDFARRERVD
ncbi:UDP:flavonoid glycosyltransferase YjiC (YdhE family) [Mycolicibacterium sp. BK556]|uniref:glycosyltransferase n=1 Tax=Mycobacteriaceae TaxID=1762 RepID=UPI00105ED945|nr:MULTISPECIES: glycosyltransferase [Mycobacteriaceae]MBB3606922.1 UDP:flavonoid glycosyltransferase YjiC (YdhE family) [Mycolicibacterium sp. BK556]MBB3636679.1 UDP:flavonoid glycosyltransferase YjiC (YdhE family) [Mycolicibacterium sp. BK607]TDO09214.1 UDP:flavonoid glycosyltransferase YjiC (YdhE family) [Mycobacterium sp. BK086]